MINNDVNSGNFIYCITHWGPYEIKKFHNVGNGFMHQYTYLIDGNLEIQFRDSEKGELVSKINTRDYNHDGSDDDERLIDHSSLSKYETIITEDEGATVMFFNPTAETRLLNVEIYKEGTYTIGLKDKRVTIVCVQHEVFANGNKLIPMQHGVVFPGKTAELIVPKNGKCAAVSYSDDLDNLLTFDSRY